MMVQRAERDQDPEPQEPRLVKQQVPQELRGFVALRPAVEPQVDDSEGVQRLGDVRR
jgi:hypothetical protein